MPDLIVQRSSGDSMRSARNSKSAGRTLSSIGSDNEENGTGPGPDSVHSSQTGSFLDREPVFESGGSSDSDSDYAPAKPARQPVSVVWQDVCVVSPTYLRFSWHLLASIHLSAPQGF